MRGTIIYQCDWNLCGSFTPADPLSQFPNWKLLNRWTGVLSRLKNAKEKLCQPCWVRLVEVNYPCQWQVSSLGSAQKPSNLAASPKLNKSDTN